jgi:hypothetical protein
MTTEMTPTSLAPMTTIQVPLSDAAQQQLRRRAAERGIPLEEFARTVLEREAAVPVPDQSAEQWVAELRAWVASHPKRDIKVDDSRESIYEGCGE